MSALTRQFDFASDAAERDFKDLPLEVIRSFGYRLRQKDAHARHKALGREGKGGE